MKTITGFVFLMGATAFAVCAAQTPAPSSAPVAAVVPAAESVPPRTLPSHPDVQSAAAQPAAPPTGHGGAYAGYQRVVSNGQERYCRNDVATGSHTERKAVCLTESQVRLQELKTQQFLQEVERRAGSEQTLPYIYGGLSETARR
jgi:hypothetical protein